MIIKVQYNVIWMWILQMFPLSMDLIGLLFRLTRGSSVFKNASLNPDMNTKLGPLREVICMVWVIPKISEKGLKSDAITSKA